MNPQLIFWMVFVSLLFLILLLDIKYNMLRDTSNALKKPFSFARVQLAWWTLIVLTSFISIMLVQKEIPTLLQSTLILLGISTATTAMGRIIDVSDATKPNIARHQDAEVSQNFFLDILSDENGVGVHRFQTVVFNMVFGIWFINEVLNTNVSGLVAEKINLIMPDISTNNLILLGLSSATYAALKSTENKPPPQPEAKEHIVDESSETESAVG